MAIVLTLLYLALTMIIIGLATIALVFVKKNMDDIARRELDGDPGPQLTPPAEKVEGTLRFFAPLGAMVGDWFKEPDFAKEYPCAPRPIENEFPGACGRCTRKPVCVLWTNRKMHEAIPITPYHETTRDGRDICLAFVPRLFEQSESGPAQGLYVDIKGHKCLDMMCDYALAMNDMWGNAGGGIVLCRHPMVEQFVEAADPLPERCPFSLPDRMAKKASEEIGDKP